MNDAGLQGVLEIFGALITTATPIVIALALLYFLWGAGKYVFAGGDGDRVKKGQDAMLFAIVVLTVMVSVWGLVQLVADTFGVRVGQDLIDVPLVNIK